MRRLTAAVVALFAFAVLAFAQQPPTRDPQAVAVAESSLEAMGAASLARLSSEQLTLVAGGTYVQYGRETPVSYPFRVKVRGWDRVRWEFEQPEGTAIMLFIGDAGWSTSPDGTTSVLSKSSLSGRLFERMPFLALAAWLNAPGADLRHLGTVNGPGIGLHRLSVSRSPAREEREDLIAAFQRMSRCEVDIDVATALPVRLRYYEHPGDWRLDLPMDLIFTNYQLAQGMRIPLNVTRFLHDKRVDEYQFQTVSFTASIPETDFALR